MKYKPNSKLERHQKYLGAFSDFCIEEEYLSNITQFIMDPKISPNDEDDIELFKDLLFESKFGKIHIYYFDRLFNKLWDKTTFDWTVRIMSKYVEFAHKISEFYSGDIFNALFTELHKTHDAISLMLKYLPHNERMCMVRVAQTYPSVLESVPKLKLYALFS